MITIQIDGKTYKPTENFWEWLKNGIRLKTGDLEEVKENKELDLEQWAIPHEECTWKPESDHSIIEKLREELDKLEKYIWVVSRERKTSDTYSIKWYLQCLNDVKNLLTSLEQSQTKEEPARPLTDEVIVPEYYAPQFEIEDYLPQLAKQVEKITQWIHSQSNK